MPKTIGVADHPQKDQLEQLWKEGLRAASLVRWLEEEGHPLVKESTLARYGQRYWTTQAPALNITSEKNLYLSDEQLADASSVLAEANKLGEVQGLSVSRTGYSIRIKPRTTDEIERDEIDALPKAPSGPIPTLDASSVDDIICHAVIPDTQVEPGRPTDHLLWISQYLKDRFHGKPLVVVHLGDHWNMGSLSSYDRGKGAMEGRRYVADIESGNRAFEVLNSQIEDEPLWEKHFLFGNHEHRIARAVEDDIRMDGLITLDHCVTPDDWRRHDFLAPVTIDGVTYAHYFYNPNTGRPYGGENVELRLKTIGHSFVMGHQQGLKMGMRYVNGRQQVGIVAGSCYQHEEDYLGPQGNAHWRGMVMLNNVEDGSFDPMPVSLDYLCRRYEGHRLRDHEGHEL